MSVTMLLTAAPVFAVSLRQDARSRNYLVEPILVDHRDTMNTEKTKHSLADIGSLMGDFSEQPPPQVFLCVYRASMVHSAVSIASARLRLRVMKSLALRQQW